jgi:hypothetical protein
MSPDQHWLESEYQRHERRGSLWIVVAVAVATLLLHLSASGDEIVINGLNRPIAVGGNRIVIVTGAEPEVMRDVVPELRPPDPNILLIPQRADEKQRLYPFLIVVLDDALPGQRQFVIARNAWRRHLDTAAELAKTQLANEKDAKALASLVDEFSKKYPTIERAALLEVAGQIPPPETKPDPSKPPPLDPSKKVSRITVVWEKDSHSIPKSVQSALQRINAEQGGSVVASDFEQDTINSRGQTPTQYIVALKAAKETGLPALVVQSGDTVLRVVKDPTAEQVLESVKQ